jgi:hypothetical protein
MSKLINSDLETQQKHWQENLEKARKVLQPYEDMSVQQVVNKLGINLFLMKKQLPNKIKDASDSARKQLARLILLKKENK